MYIRKTMYDLFTGEIKEYNMLDNGIKKLKPRKDSYLIIIYSDLETSPTIVKQLLLEGASEAVENTRENLLTMENNLIKNFLEFQKDSKNLVDNSI